ncbi:MAG: hypothetical protein HZY79_00490 [Rhodoblastus sp.]|nr:MAG: hypothetical protein HZY79_00490 [Rhodoblastus sp.]
MLELLGLRLSRSVVAVLGVALVVALFVAFAAVERRAATQTMQRAVAQAREDARSACDARWRAEIEKSNAQAARDKAAQSEVAARTRAQAEAEIAALKSALTDMETKNAALPHGDRCGLERGRVRILPQ